VIDEIDGALGDGKGAVDVILKMVCVCMLVLRLWLSLGLLSINSLLVLPLSQFQ